MTYLNLKVCGHGCTLHTGKPMCSKQEEIKICMWWCQVWYHNKCSFCSKLSVISNTWYQWNCVKYYVYSHVCQNHLLDSVKELKVSYGFCQRSQRGKNIDFLSFYLYRSTSCFWNGDLQPEHKQRTENRMLGWEEYLGLGPYRSVSVDSTLQHEYGKLQRVQHRCTDICHKSNKRNKP